MIIKKFMYSPLYVSVRLTKNLNDYHQGKVILIVDSTIEIPKLLKESVKFVPIFLPFVRSAAPII